MFLFDTYWTEALRLLMPWAELFFRVITELGSEYFFVTLIAIGFWAVDKRVSMLTAFILIVSVVSNYWLKITFRNLRPSTTNWLPGVNVSNYGLPSGHAQNSTTLWGWLGITIKTWWMIVISIVLIFLIGLSRIYIGVHWLGDVFLGWTVGALLFLVLWKLEEPARRSLSKYNPNMLYLGVVVFGLVVTVLTEHLSPVTIVGLEDNFGANGGLIIGLGIGLILENKYLNFEINKQKKHRWRVMLRIIFGLILVFGAMLALSPIFPTEIYWLRAIRFSLVALIIVFIWPFVFKNLNM